MLYSRGCKCFDSKFRFRRLGFTSPLFSPNFSVLSLFFFFFQARLYWGPSYMHAATSEEQREETGSLACSLPDGIGGELVPYMG